MRPACRLLFLLCVHYCQHDANPATFTTASSKASAASAISPHVLSAAHKAQLALPVLSSTALVTGFLTAAAELHVQAVQLLATPLAAAAAAAAAVHPSQQQQGQQQQGTWQARPRAPQLRRDGAPPGSSKQQNSSKQQSLRGKGGTSKGSNSNKGSTQQKKAKLSGPSAASQDRLFARTQSQQQRQLGSQGWQGLGSADANRQQGLADDLLCLFEGVLLHMMPAAVQGWEALELSDSSVTAAAGGGAVGPVGCGVWRASGGAAPSCEAQQAGVATLQAVLGVLQAVLDAGGAVAGTQGPGRP